MLPVVRPTKNKSIRLNYKFQKQDQIFFYFLSLVKDRRFVCPSLMNFAKKLIAHLKLANFKIGINKFNRISRK